MERRWFGESDPEGQREVSEIRVRVGGGRSRLVARAEGTVSRGGRLGTFLTGPELSGGFVYWQRTTYLGDTFSSREDILRTPVTGGGVTSITRAGRLWSSVGRDGGDLDLYDFTVAADELFYRFGDFASVHIGRVAPRPPRFE